MKKITFILFILTTALFSTAQLKYEKQEIYITMRDGIRLNTVVYAPVGPTEALPFLLLRTPYGVSDQISPDKTPYTADLAKEGYIFVYQDIRGRYKSEGQFEMQRFSRNKKDPKAIDESTDTWDTIDWLLKNIRNNNGKAGMYGISYDGWTSVQGAVDPHPALIAVSEQATPADMWLGDDFHHNGAFRLSYGFEYAFMEEAAKTDTLFPFGNFDLYDWFLKLGPLSNVNRKYFHSKIPTWNNYVAHPDYDAFWQKQGLASRLDSPRVYIQHVGGFWDQEDLYGPQTAYALLEKNDRHNRNYFVAGPWNHGGWAGGKGDRLGNIKFDSATGEYFRKNLQARWFNYHLKGIGDGNFAEATTFQTGSNQWKSYSTWPPAEAESRKLYFHDNGKLAFNAPAIATGSDSYVSDPSKPVPYRIRPIEQTYGAGSRWFTWLTEDQRFVHNRPDVLSWETETLTEDITVTGNVLAQLFASTSGTDADFVVKLIDVYPDEVPKDIRMGGYQLMVASEVFRGRYRNSYEKPRPFTPGKVETVKFDLHQVNHVFKKGHRIMVQVQSTWFPLIDRNPQKYVPNIFEAKESDFIKATINIFRNSKAASHVVLPVIR